MGDKNEHVRKILFVTEGPQGLHHGGICRYRCGFDPDSHCGFHKPWIFNCHHYNQSRWRYGLVNRKKVDSE